MTNRCEMCFVGLKRSGNHAVINWIGQQFPGTKVDFLNNCRPCESPQDTKHPQDSPESILFHDYRIDRDTGRFDEKDCLIYSYEDRSLDDVYGETAAAHHDRWIGKSA